MLHRIPVRHTLPLRAAVTCQESCMLVFAGRRQDRQSLGLRLCTRAAVAAPEKQKQKQTIQLDVTKVQSRHDLKFSPAKLKDTTQHSRLQMAPLGDRLLVKPREAEKVSALLPYQHAKLLLHCISMGYTVPTPVTLFDPSLTAPCVLLQTTTGGILLTAGTTQPIQEALIGQVLAVGEDVKVEVKIGDTVIFSKYSSTDVKAPDGDISFVAEKSILATLS